MKIKSIIVCAFLAFALLFSGCEYVEIVSQDSEASSKDKSEVSLLSEVLESSETESESKVIESEANSEERWPCMLYIAESRYLEAMTVTLQLSLLVASVILVGHLQAAICEIMPAETHQFICKSAKVLSCMTCSTVILLEELITGKSFICNGRIISEKPLIKCRVRSDECTLEMFDGICDIRLGDSVWIYSLECLCELPVGIQFRNDLVE